MRLVRKAKPGTRIMLHGQLGRVRNVMRDGRWRPVREISELLGEHETSVSARVRDLRKRPYGGYEVERKYRDGEYHYRLRRAV